MSFAIISLSPERRANGKTSLIGKIRHSTAGPARKLFANMGCQLARTLMALTLTLWLAAIQSHPFASKRDSASGKLNFEDVLSWVAESFGIDGSLSSIVAIIWAGAFGTPAATLALSSNDVAPCGRAPTSEVRELVLSFVAPFSGLGFGVGAVASTLVSGDGAS
jgi:hypothetical protein